MNPIKKNRKMAYLYCYASRSLGREVDILPTIVNTNLYTKNGPWCPIGEKEEDLFKVYRMLAAQKYIRKDGVLRSRKEDEIEGPHILYHEGARIFQKFDEDPSGEYRWIVLDQITFDGGLL